MIDVRTASFPWRGGWPPHLPVGPGDVAECVLLPGDPDRVDLVAGLLGAVRDFGRKRQYRVITGTYEGVAITVCSTGIGGPSTEIAVVELANLGARKLIRVGGMGALAEDLALGDFLIVDRAAGGTGVARDYDGGTGPVFASPPIVDALVAAARELGLRHRVGQVITTDSYYRGQHRRLWATDDPVATAPLEAAARAGAAGFDMETEALFAVGRALNVAVGAALAVHGHRVSDTWLEDYELVQRDVVRLAATALARLTAGVGEQPGRIGNGEVRQIQKGSKGK